MLLHILEALDLTVQPHSIVVLNRPGEPQRKRIAVTNQGNVTFSVGDVGEVDLEDDTIPDDAGRLRLEPLTEIGKKEIEAHGHKGPVLVLLRIGRPGAFREAGLSVRKLGDKVNIAPGESGAHRPRYHSSGKAAAQLALSRHGGHLDSRFGNRGGLLWRPP